MDGFTACEDFVAEFVGRVGLGGKRGNAGRDARVCWGPPRFALLWDAGFCGERAQLHRLEEGTVHGTKIEAEDLRKSRSFR
jgi:hypothetical protein